MLSPMIINTNKPGISETNKQPRVPFKVSQKLCFSPRTHDFCHVEPSEHAVAGGVRLPRARPDALFWFDSTSNGCGAMTRAVGSDVGR